MVWFALFNDTGKAIGCHVRPYLFSNVRSPLRSDIVSTLSHIYSHKPPQRKWPYMQSLYACLIWWFAVLEKYGHRMSLPVSLNNVKPSNVRSATHKVFAYGHFLWGCEWLMAPEVNAFWALKSFCCLAYAGFGMQLAITIHAYLRENITSWKYIYTFFFIDVNTHMFLIQNCIRSFSLSWDPWSHSSGLGKVGSLDE